MEMGLKIFDGYRPFSVQQRMWHLVPDERYVSNPSNNRGRHTRGTAVDVTLVDRVGNELPMPSYYDEFSERSHRNYTQGSSETIHNRDVLENVMCKAGFIPYAYEWWHFDWKDWQQYPVLDISIDDLLTGNTTAVVIPENEIMYC